MLCQTRLFLLLSASISLVGCETTDISKAEPGAADSSTSTDVSSGSSTTITNYSTITAISTVTETETEIQTQTQTATVTATATATVIIPTTVTSTATVTASSLQTVTATTTRTVTATASAVPTATATVPSTVTATVTNSSTRTVTATQTINNTSTVTVTATNTDVSVEPSSGVFTSDACFENKAASDGFGRRLFSRQTFTFDRGNKGSDFYILFEDSGCEKEFMRWTSRIKYKMKKHVGNLFVIEVEQRNSDRHRNDVTKYWIAGLSRSSGWIFDVDYVNGALGPFLKEPSDRDVEEIAANVGKRGLLFKRVSAKAN